MYTHKQIVSNRGHRHKIQKGIKECSSKIIELKLVHVIIVPNFMGGVHVLCTIKRPMIHVYQVIRKKFGDKATH